MKTLPFTAAHTYIAYKWECPPPLGFRLHSYYSSKKYWSMSLKHTQIYKTIITFYARNFDFFVHHYFHKDIVHDGTNNTKKKHCVQTLPPQARACSLSYFNIKIMNQWLGVIPSQIILHIYI